MNGLAGELKVELADLGDAEEPELQPSQPAQAVHQPIAMDAEMTEQEAEIVFDDDVDLPELVGGDNDEDSVSESSDSDDDMSETTSDPDDDERFGAELKEMDGQADQLETDDSGSSTPQDNQGVHLGKTARENAGVRRYDENYNGT
jgi:hypothetical protein